MTLIKQAGAPFEVIRFEGVPFAFREAAKQGESTEKGSGGRELVKGFEQIGRDPAGQIVKMCRKSAVSALQKEIKT